MQKIELKPFTRILNPGKLDGYQVFVNVRFDGLRLSITGVVGPMGNGDFAGSCGQIDGVLRSVEPGQGWSKSEINELRSIWERWHLNDMRPGCKHQMAQGWDKKVIPFDELPNSKSNRNDKGILAGWIYAPGNEYCSQSEVHKDGLLLRPCPECGYRYGSSWNTEEVPESVISRLNEFQESKITPAWV